MGSWGVPDKRIARSFLVASKAGNKVKTMTYVHMYSRTQYTPEVHGL